MGITPHRLRHTAASPAIAAGADVKVIQLMPGHKDASMTLNVYGICFRTGWTRSRMRWTRAARSHRRWLVRRSRRTGDRCGMY